MSCELQFLPEGNVLPGWGGRLYLIYNVQKVYKKKKNLSVSVQLEGCGVDSSLLNVWLSCCFFVFFSLSILDFFLLFYWLAAHANFLKGLTIHAAQNHLGVRWGGVLSNQRQGLSNFNRVQVCERNKNWSNCRAGRPNY